MGIETMAAIGGGMSLLSALQGSKTGQTGGNPYAAMLGPDIANLMKLIFTGQGIGGTGGGKAIPSSLDAITGGMAGKLAARGGNGLAPTEQTTAIAQNIARIIGGADVAGTGQAAGQLIEQDIGRNVANIRERYTASGGGSSMGTPAAVAEGLYRAEATPRKALALSQIDQSQLAAILPLIQLAMGYGSTGFAPAATTVEDPFFTKLLGSAGGAAEGLGWLKYAGLMG